MRYTSIPKYVGTLTYSSTPSILGYFIRQQKPYLIMAPVYSEFQVYTRNSLGFKISKPHKKIRKPSKINSSRINHIGLLKRDRLMFYASVNVFWLMVINDLKFSLTSWATRYKR